MRARLRESIDANSPKRRGRHPQKKVRYQLDQGNEKYHGHSGPVKRKEDIRIPSPPPRQISRAEQVIAFIMSPTDAPSRIHGLHGKKLM